MDRLKTVLHPLYHNPALVFAHNIEESQFTDALRSLIVSLFAAAFLLLALRVLLKDWLKAAFITSLALILFFSYGHVYGTLKLILPSGALIVRHRLLAPLWLGIFAFGTWWASRRKIDLRLPNQALNVIAIVVLVFPLLQTSLYQRYLFSFSIAAAAGSTGTGSEPDIYYIIRTPTVDDT
jgi:hypothetical protein